jgi:PAT family beta-lactamase induction signal transducer AmpG
MHAAKPSVSPLLWVPTGYFTMALGYVMLTSCRPGACGAAFT